MTLEEAWKKHKPLPPFKILIEHSQEWIRIESIDITTSSIRFYTHNCRDLIDENVKISQMVGEMVAYF